MEADLLVCPIRDMTMSDLVNYYIVMARRQNIFISYIASSSFVPTPPSSAVDPMLLISMPTKFDPLKYPMIYIISISTYGILQ